MGYKYQQFDTRNMLNSQIFAVVFGVIALTGVVSIIIIASRYDYPAITASELDDADFKNFIAEYSKKYSSLDEFHYRYQIFKSNLDKISEHNAKQSSWTMAINKFTDLTPEEFIQTMTLEPFQTDIEYLLEDETIDIPESVDWMNSVYIPKKQQISSCKEASTDRTHRNKFMNLVDECDQGEYNLGSVLDLDVYQPYLDCNLNSKSDQKSHFYQRVKSRDEKQLKRAVAKRPILILIDASSWQFYRSGILAEEDCEYINRNHTVLLVGYGTEIIEDISYDYWIIYNSWGSDWGETGRIRITRNQETCGIGYE
jgi:C1A family cysteine protease